MTSETDSPKPRRPRPATRERLCGICGQSYTYPVKGQTSTRRLCADCAALPVAVSGGMLRMANRIRELEKQLKTLSEKLQKTSSPVKGDSS